ncbi:MAG: family 1 glycosylhydrolase [Anaerolineae bacterium]|nr:family 1 glycosylhydrolase [Anaerolineae bacterium]
MPIKEIHQFPRGFLWGCATDSHQVECDNHNDWKRWEETPGHIFHNQKSGKACEWWAGRYKEDFDRAMDMHNNAQRFSIEWSRIEPEPGKWDEAALSHYRDMLKALHERGMTPMVTLHHFTNPLWIADHHGWLWDETPAHFERYVRKVVGALGDLCTLWCTINEPVVYTTLGYSLGTWPPGMRSARAINRVILNLLRGHAAAYHAIKEIQPAGQVGHALHYVALKPSRPTMIHWPAARLIDRFFNRAFVMAMHDGLVRLPGIRPVQLPQVKGTMDWVGLQYYQLFDAGFSLFSPSSLFVRQHKPQGMPVGPGTWGALDPDRIFEPLKWLWTAFRKPIYVTECGVPDPEDSIRPGYLIKSVRSMWRAVNFNFDVRGFFFWSLLDNFEWAEGYDPRFHFGLYKTDFETQQRIPRQSARLYREICSQNGLSATTVSHYAPSLLNETFPGEAGQNDVKLKPHNKNSTPG